MASLRPSLPPRGYATLALVALTAALAGCGVQAPAGAVHAKTPVVSKARALTPIDQLRVVGGGSVRRLADRSGRPVTLLGVGVNAFVDYGHGAAPSPLTPDDPARMASLGLNAVRLAVSWSRLMPAPGGLSSGELARVTDTVRRLADAGIYTVLSMHQDRYAADLGTGTEFDGAPAWAVDTGGRACGEPGVRYYTPCAAHAAAAFYSGAQVSGRSLQDWYGDAALALAAAGRAAGPGYAGLDILNEPTDPNAWEPAFATARWRAQLEALQRRLVARLRESGERAPIWIQPQGPRATEPGRAPFLPALNDRQLVYAPHAYVDVYNTHPGLQTGDRLAAQYQAFVREARSIDAALVIGEFPGASGGAWDMLRREHRRLQRSAGIGAFSWLWQQPDSGYGWGLLDERGQRRPGTDSTVVLSGARVLAGVGVTLRGTASRMKISVKRKHSSTVDVWLGTRFTRAPVNQVVRLTAATRGVKLIGVWTPTALLGNEVASGVMLRVRLPAGKARATVVRAAPAGASGTRR